MIAEWNGRPHCSCCQKPVVLVPQLCTLAGSGTPLVREHTCGRPRPREPVCARLRKSGQVGVSCWLPMLLLACAHPAPVPPPAPQPIVVDLPMPAPIHQATPEELASMVTIPARGHATEAPVWISSTVFFDTDSAVLSPGARRELADLRGTLRVVGHCDERGSREYNLALGQRRAGAVASYLRKMGVTVRATSRGKEEPVDAGHSEEAWVRNRRAVVTR